MKVLYVLIWSYIKTIISYENCKIIQNNDLNICHEHHETDQILWNIHDIHSMKQSEDKLHK